MYQRVINADAQEAAAQIGGGNACRDGERQGKERVEQDQPHIHPADLSIVRADCFHCTDLPHLTAENIGQRVIGQGRAEKQRQDADNEQNTGDRVHIVHRRMIIRGPQRDGVHTVPGLLKPIGNFIRRLLDNRHVGVIFVKSNIKVVPFALKLQLFQRIRVDIHLCRLYKDKAVSFRANTLVTHTCCQGQRDLITVFSTYNDILSDLDPKLFDLEVFQSRLILFHREFSLQNLNMVQRPTVVTDRTERQCLQVAIGVINLH